MRTIIFLEVKMEHFGCSFHTASEYFLPLFLQQQYTQIPTPTMSRGMATNDHNDHNPSACVGAKSVKEES